MQPAGACKWPCGPANPRSGTPLNSTAQIYTERTPSACICPRPPPHSEAFAPPYAHTTRTPGSSPPHQRVRARGRSPRMATQGLRRRQADQGLCPPQGNQKFRPRAPARFQEPSNLFINNIYANPIRNSCIQCIQGLAPDKEERVAAHFKC